MDWLSVLRKNLIGIAIGAAVNQVPVPVQAEPIRDNGLFVEPSEQLNDGLPTPLTAMTKDPTNVDQGPTPAALSRGERAKDQWEKVADLPAEPGIYVTYDLQSRQLCHVLVYPANKAESRMDYAIHCGVDTRPKAEK